MKAKQRKTNSLETNSIAVISCTLTDAGIMEFPWSFHAVSMQVSCWLHAGFADLAYWCVTSMTTPWNLNLHGTSMEPASVRVHDKANKCR